MDLILVTQARPSSVVVAVRGDLDLDSAPRLRRHIDALLGPPSAVLLDLTHLGFCDAAGLGVIVEAGAELRERGAALALVRPPRQLCRVLQITGLDQHLAIYPSPETAEEEITRTSAL